MLRFQTRGGRSREWCSLPLSDPSSSPSPLLFHSLSLLASSVPCSCLASSPFQQPSETWTAPISEVSCKGYYGTHTETNGITHQIRTWFLGIDGPDALHLFFLHCFSIFLPSLSVPFFFFLSPFLSPLTSHTVYISTFFTHSQTLAFYESFAGSHIIVFSNILIQCCCTVQVLFW